MGETWFLFLQQDDQSSAPACARYLQAGQGCLGQAHGGGEGTVHHARQAAVNAQHEAQGEEAESAEKVSSTEAGGLMLALSSILRSVSRQTDSIY